LVLTGSLDGKANQASLNASCFGARREGDGRGGDGKGGNSGRMFGGKGRDLGLKLSEIAMVIAVRVSMETT